MANRSWSGPAYLSHPSISEESIHVDRCLWSEVNKETKKQPNPHLREERSATNTKGPSYSNRDREVEKLRERVEMLWREAERNEELLRRKDEELFHQRESSLVPSHSQDDERNGEDKYRRRDKKQPPPHGERMKSPHRERTVSPPYKRNRREEQNREKSKGPIPQRSTFPNP